MTSNYIVQLGLSASLLLTGLGLSSESIATSKGYDSSAKVVLKDNVPCFFVERPDDTQLPVGQSLAVETNRGPTVWNIYENSGRENFPNSAARCIKYGADWPTGKVVKAPQALQYGVPYYADIETEYRFRVEFCLSHDVHGKPQLTQWANDGKRCTDKPINETDSP
ncbi:hypothetical protein [Collimonas humicola]|uniref:hypothetical protein n=1 Tax=Collimonas humicola TaxID=2825886 RepID=UPI001B8C6848|nr:hypothetical protein [Collimonas humicola]